MPIHSPAFRWDASTPTLPAAVLAVGKADWHVHLWQQADHGLLAAAQAMQGGLSGAHTLLVDVLAEAGLPLDAAAVLGTVSLGLLSLLGLYIVLVFPHRRLRREIRQLRAQLEELRCPDPEPHPAAGGA